LTTDALFWKISSLLSYTEQTRLRLWFHHKVWILKENIYIGLTIILQEATVQFIKHLLSHLCTVLLSWLMMSTILLNALTSSQMIIISSLLDRDIIKITKWSHHNCICKESKELFLPINFRTKKSIIQKL